MNNNYYTLHQAVEWIAFRKTNISAQDLTNQALLNKAKQELHTVLISGKIKIKATVLGINEDIDLSISENDKIDYGTNTITRNPYLKYKNVKIDISNIKHLFPSIDTPNKNIFIPTDLSIYMKIMLEVINEQQISVNKQGKKEYLALEMQRKMDLYNVPNSKHLAQSMATLIRNPESQKGKAKK